MVSDSVVPSARDEFPANREINRGNSSASPSTDPQNLDFAGTLAFSLPEGPNSEQGVNRDVTGKEQEPDHRFLNRISCRGLR